MSDTAYRVFLGDHRVNLLPSKSAGHENVPSGSIKEMELGPFRCPLLGTEGSEPGVEGQNCCLSSTPPASPTPISQMGQVRVLTSCQQWQADGFLIL